MTTALDAARYLVRLGFTPDEPEDSDFLCPLRVQKLLYYVQGWSLGINDVPMFSERIEAWAHGPVVRDLYAAPPRLEGDDHRSAGRLGVLPDIRERFLNDAVERRLQRDREPPLLPA